MPRPPTVDRFTFLANVRRSGLVGAEQLTTVARALPDTNRGRVVARELVARGLLTRFQAEQILAGRTGGFLLGQYQILDQLGQGGMGRVFKARHLALDRVVALKVLAPSLLKTERAHLFFQREVRSAAQLTHANIVAAFDAGQAAGRHFLVLEYIDGPNLDQLVRQQGPLPVGQACDYVRQIATGLQVAHEAGMVHRDIKPANVLVQFGRDRDNPYGIAKISDFGLARLQVQEADGIHTGDTILTRGNTVLGTPDYLSPEQARSLHQADIRSDLYSLGCTFYFLLTGRVPYPGGLTLEKLIRHSTETATAIEELRPDVPSEVAGIVRRLMVKAPTERYQAPAELADDLAPLAVGGPVFQCHPRTSTAPFDDQLPTPTGEEEHGPDSEAADGLFAPDERSALNATLVMGNSDTPASVRLADTAGTRRRTRLALLWTLAIVGALTALAGGLAWLTW